MSIADKITRLTAARDGIRTALVNKGVSAASHGFEDFAADIGSIQTGAANTKRFEVDLSADVTSGYTTLVGGNADMLAHRSDGSAVAMMYYLGANGAVPFPACLISVKGNTELATGYYGTSMRKYNASTVYTSNFSYKLTVQVNSAGDVYINASGDLQVMGSTTYPLKAGKYLVVFAW